MIKVKVLDANCEPFKGHEHDAGWDLRVRARTRLWPNRTYLVPTGLCIGIPVGYMGDIRPRSSTSKNQLLVQGTIDPGYTGEVQIIVTNLSGEVIELYPGDRLAQLVVMKTDTELEYVDELEESSRGTDGFGSTGRK